MKTAVFLVLAFVTVSVDSLIGGLKLGIFLKLSFNVLELDDRSMRIAETELGETPVIKLLQTGVIKKWITSLDYLNCRNDDEFILRFLRVSKFSPKGTQQRIINYGVARTSLTDGMPEWFENQNVNDKEVMEVLEKGFVYPLPGTDDNGCLVVVTQFERAFEVDPKKYGQAVFLMLDYIIARYPRSQVNGIIFLQSGEGFTPEIMMYWNLVRTPKLFEIWQDALPIRIKELHWYNVPFYARYVVDAILLAMNRKMKDALTIHTKVEVPLGIPANIVPVSFGGTGPEWEDLKDDILNDIRAYRSEFESLRDCKVNDSKRPKKVSARDGWSIF